MPCSCKSSCYVPLLLAEGAAVLCSAAAGAAPASTFPLDVYGEFAGAGGDLRQERQQGPRSLSFTLDVSRPGKVLQETSGPQAANTFPKKVADRERIVPWKVRGILQHQDCWTI